MAVRDHWLGVAAQMPRFHRWPNYEVFELLSTDNKVDGFRVHFSNGSVARFRRSIGGVEVVNVILEGDGTINFMCGCLDELQQTYMVDGQEVDFGDQHAVDAFEVE